MGSEAPCTLHHNGVVVFGIAQLETTYLRFRGPLRLTIPFTDITSLDEEQGRLSVDHRGQVTVFDLGSGPVAARWLQQVRNPKTVVQKLGVKAGQRVCLIQFPEHGFADQLEAAGIHLIASLPESDAVFIGVEAAEQLAALARLREQLSPNAAVWVVYPKGVKAVTEMEVLLAGRIAGFTDTKVVAFSATHTALRFVTPKTERPPSPAQRRRRWA